MLEGRYDPPIPEILARRSLVVGPLLTELRTVAAHERAGDPFQRIVSDLTHMFINRLFPVVDRWHDLLVHDALALLYHAQARRSEPGEAE
jgi:hypothetical protein